MSTARKGYPSDVSDEEWAFVAPYLALQSAGAAAQYDLREVFNGLRWLVRTGAQWRMLPHDFPRWEAVYQQTQRWLRAGGFEAIVHDLRLLLRLASGTRRAALGGDPGCPHAAVDARERGACGLRRPQTAQGAKVHVAVDTLGHLLAMVVTPASEQERAQVAELAEQVQEVTGERVELAYVDQGYTGEEPAEAAAEHRASSWRWSSCPMPKDGQGFVLLPRRWVVERSFAWLARFRRLARDYERLPQTVAGLTFLAFTCLMLSQLIHLAFSS